MWAYIQWYQSDAFMLEFVCWLRIFSGIPAIHVADILAAQSSLWFVLIFLFISMCNIILIWFLFSTGCIPDNSYGFDVLGDPKVIPKLTFEEFKVCYILMRKISYFVHHITMLNFDIVIPYVLWPYICICIVS